MKNKLLVILLLGCTLFYSCVNNHQVERRLAKKITNNFCDKFENYISTRINQSFISNFLNGDVPSFIISTGDQSINSICKCLQNKVEVRLMETYTLNELRMIEKDNLKKIAVIDGLLENSEFQKEFFYCINKIYDEYKDTKNKVRKSK